MKMTGCYEVLTRESKLLCVCVTVFAREFNVLAVSLTVHTSECLTCSCLPDISPLFTRFYRRCRELEAASNEVSLLACLCPTNDKFKLSLCLNNYQ